MKKLGIVIIFFVLAFLALLYLVSAKQQPSSQSSVTPINGISPPPTFNQNQTPEPAARGSKLLATSEKLLAAASATRNLDGTLLQINQIDVCHFPRIDVYGTVTNKDGSPITNIKNTDFVVFEDNKKIEQVSINSLLQVNSPMSVGLTIDHSGSMKGKPMTEAQNAAKSFVSQMNDQDKISIIGFDSNVHTLLTPSSDKNTIISTLNNIQPTSDTALYDAIGQTVSTVGQCGRKAIVVLSDGKDTASKQLTMAKAIDQANLSNTPLFVVGLESSQFTPDILEQLAVKTGGQYFQTPTPAELTTLYTKINHQLKNQYLFSFTSQITKDTNEHRIKLEIPLAGSTTASEKSYILIQN